MHVHIDAFINYIKIRKKDILPIQCVHIQMTDGLLSFIDGYKKEFDEKMLTIN